MASKNSKTGATLRIGAAILVTSVPVCQITVHAANNAEKLAALRAASKLGTIQAYSRTAEGTLGPIDWPQTGWDKVLSSTKKEKDE
jgi:hypothetical protein